MKALTWHGIEDVRVEEVPDPRIQEPTDAIVKVTSTAICGSDLHLYKVLAPYLQPGDILGHEFMGIVEEVGSGVANLAVGDRVVVPFNISCGRCWMCERGLFAQCETTQNRDQGKGASLFGYTSLYGSVPGGQAELVRVPHADFGPIRLGTELPDERYLYLSDILPTAWQGVEYADVPQEGSLLVLGLGPVGLMAVRSARQMGIANIIGVDLEPARLSAAAGLGATVLDWSVEEDVAESVRELTNGRGADGVLDAVGMEAHGSPVSEKVIGAASRLPKPVARAAIENVGIDRLAALHLAVDCARRGGTVSVSGVYGGAASPMPLMDIFDKGLTMRHGQCHVRAWTDGLLELAELSNDPLELQGFATHHAPLEDAAEKYAVFQEKRDGCIKVILEP